MNNKDEKKWRSRKKFGGGMLLGVVGKDRIG